MIQKTIRNTKSRRAISLSLLVAGGVFIFLAPDDVWVGVALLVVGVALEIIGARMYRQ
jgi:hypothetical protein